MFMKNRMRVAVSKMKRTKRRGKTSASLKSKQAPNAKLRHEAKARRARLARARRRKARAAESAQRSSAFSALTFPNSLQSDCTIGFGLPTWKPLEIDLNLGLNRPLQVFVAPFTNETFNTKEVQPLASVGCLSSLTTRKSSSMQLWEAPESQGIIPLGMGSGAAPHYCLIEAGSIAAASPWSHTPQIVPPPMKLCSAVSCGPSHARNSDSLTPAPQITNAVCHTSASSPASPALVQNAPYQENAGSDLSRPIPTGYSRTTFSVGYSSPSGRKFALSLTHEGRPSVVASIAIAAISTLGGLAAGAARFFFTH